MDHHLVKLADCKAGILSQIQGKQHFDVLIIDPDLPDMEITTLLKTLSENLPGIAVIIHAYLNDINWETKGLVILAHVEKKANSIDAIRKSIMTSQKVPV